MIGGKMIGHRPISTSQHHPGAQRRQLRTGTIEAEQGQRGHGGRKPGKGMNLATSPQNECENRRRRPSRGLAHTPGTPIFALFRWTSERAASIRCPDGGSGQGSFASFLKGPLPPSGHRIERGTIDLQSDINCLPERSLLGAFGKQHDDFDVFKGSTLATPHGPENGVDYDHDVFNSAGSTLATPHFGPENGVHLTQTAQRFGNLCGKPLPFDRNYRYVRIVKSVVIVPVVVFRAFSDSNSATNHKGNRVQKSSGRAFRGRWGSKLRFCKIGFAPSIRPLDSLQCVLWRLSLLGA